MKAIEVKNVSKTYKLYEKNLDLIKELFGKKRHKSFEALKDVSFSVKKGITYGVVGRNGSGKSTILKMISGTTYPTSGHVHTIGKVSLLNIGGGIISGFTGRENIYYKCKLLGMKKKEIDSKIESIIEFSELGSFIDQPVKKYSSGMISKLGFSISIHIEPDILIIDEALAVGDSRFQSKCMDKMNALKEKNTTILYVSHAAGQIESFCDQAVFIDKGEVVIEGDSKKVAKFYNDFMNNLISEDEIKKKKLEHKK